MTRNLNVRSAVANKDYADALRQTAEKVAADLDACDDISMRSTLSRTLSTVLTSLRLAEAAVPPEAEGKSLLDKLREEASG